MREANTNTKQVRRYMSMAFTYENRGREALELVKIVVIVNTVVMPANKKYSEVTSG